MSYLGFEPLITASERGKIVHILNLSVTGDFHCGENDVIERMNYGLTKSPRRRKRVEEPNGKKSSYFLYAILLHSEIIK
jgi:hypothetical protein